MAPNKKLLSKLLSLSGAVTERENIHNDVLATDSPSFNFIFGNGHGLPTGYTMLLYGPPRGGKSIILNMMIGHLHQSDPDAIAVKFNTEMREHAQLDAAAMRLYGIDPERLIAYETNRPDEIYDRIEKDLAAMKQEGLNIKLIGIDSETGIVGRRTLNADTVMTQQVGDDAKTRQDGLKQILAVQRRNKFGLVLTSQLRVVIDKSASTTGTVHKSHTAAMKPATSLGTQHHAEYYVYVEPRAGKEGRTDEDGNSFIDESVSDARGEGEQKAHKILVRMIDSSFGPKGRSGMFTFDYSKGLINVHEEVFHLGVGRGIIDRPTAMKYAFGGKEWVGKPAFLAALKADPEMQKAIIRELKRRELAGALPEPVNEPESSPS